MRAAVGFAPAPEPPSAANDGSYPAAFRAVSALPAPVLLPSGDAIPMAKVTLNLGLGLGGNSSDVAAAAATAATAAAPPQVPPYVPDVSGTSLGSPSKPLPGLSGKKDASNKSPSPTKRDGGGEAKREGGEGVEWKTKRTSLGLALSEPELEISGSQIDISGWQTDEPPLLPSAITQLSIGAAEKRCVGGPETPARVVKMAGNVHPSPSARHGLLPQSGQAKDGSPSRVVAITAGRLPRPNESPGLFLPNELRNRGR